MANFNLYGHLCGELAAALARRITELQYWPDWTVVTNVEKPGLKGATIYHGSVSAFEAATAALTSYGLLTPVPRADKPGETWFCLHVLTMNADEMPEYLVNSVIEQDDRLAGLLEAFLAIFCHYDALSERRVFFTPPDYLAAAMSMLARTGYAERAGDQFRWTEKISLTMKAADIWDEHSASIGETIEAELEESAQLAWQTMPDTLKMKIRSGNASVFDFAKILALGWRDGRWHAFKLDDPVVLRHTELPMARRLFEIAEDEKR